MSVVRTGLTAIATVDQSQLIGGTGIGSGQIAGVKSRGQAFTPTVATISSIAFYLKSQGSTDIKLYLTDVDQSTKLPTGSPLATWTIANANIVVAYTTYTLSPAYTSMTPGHIYAIYFEPSSGGSYSDDYRDLDMNITNPYAGGLMFKYESSAWAAEAGVDMVFATGYLSGSGRNSAASRTASRTGRGSAL